MIIKLNQCRALLNYANDNHHEWWIYNDNIHVPSLFDYADMAAIRRKNFEVVK